VIVDDAKPPNQCRFFRTISQLRLYVPGVVGAVIQRPNDA
jgi:hypothetical protein